MRLDAEDYRHDLGSGGDWLPLKRKIKLSNDLMEIYWRFEETMFLHYDTEEIEALNGGALVNKLLQFAAGAVYNESKKIVAIHDEKIEALRELKEELGDQPLMVCYWFKSSLDRLKKAFPKAVVMDKAVIRASDRPPSPPRATAASPRPSSACRWFGRRIGI
jgi:hypothetical protein